MHNANVGEGKFVVQRSSGSVWQCINLRTFQRDFTSALFFPMMADVYLPCSDHTAVCSPVPAGRATLEHPDNESLRRLGDILVFALFFFFLIPSLKLHWKKSRGPVYCVCCSGLLE